MKVKKKYIDVKSKTKQKEILEETTVYPAFSFRYIHKDFNVDKCETDDKVYFLQRIVKLCSLTWQDIKSADRHGFGTEKIDKNIIKQQLPKEVTEDIPLLALRFRDKKPFVGFWNKYVFYVLFIDSKFTLYKH